MQMDYKMKRSVFCLLGVLMLAGCAPKVNDFVDYNQKSMLLSLGMDKSSVMQTVGAPRRTDVNSERERWIYWNKSIYGYSIVDNENLATDRLVITLVNGKVTKWGRQTLSDDILESTQKTAQVYVDAAKTSK